MTSKLVKSVQSLRQLERAWQAIRENARDSKSEDIKREVQTFADNASANIYSICYRLSRRKFKFEPAKGIPIPKTGPGGGKSKTKFRPIVLAPLESRIVQRSILESLISHEEIAKFAVTPFSFGGVRKRSAQELAAVPAAISAVLNVIEGGARYVACADIQSFFTRIPKSAVRDVVRNAVKDEDFMSLFDAAIKVELANLTNLRERAELFPIEDIGVAQGNSLSPLLGNILLFDFDSSMNAGDCRCIRYIDDFIILAPTSAAASARMRKAISILSAHGMALSPEKSSNQPTSTLHPFTFLGIEFNNGLIRPSEQSRKRLFVQIDGAMRNSVSTFRAHRPGQIFPKRESLISVLKRVDGMVHGWSKHYNFCNDEVLICHLDELLKECLRKYLGAYSDARARFGGSDHQMFLGVEQFSAIHRTPFVWPATR